MPLAPDGCRCSCSLSRFTVRCLLIPATAPEGCRYRCRNGGSFLSDDCDPDTDSDSDGLSVSNCISVAPPGLFPFCILPLGLAPQAMEMSPLRCFAAADSIFSMLGSTRLPRPLDLRVRYGPDGCRWLRIRLGQECHPALNHVPRGDMAELGDCARRARFNDPEGWATLRYSPRTR